MAYTPIYTRKNFVNNSAPAINATNLNDIEDALVSLENGLQTAAADTDTNTGDISALQSGKMDANNPTGTGDLTQGGNISAGGNVTASGDVKDGSGNVLSNKMDAVDIDEINVRSADTLLINPPVLERVPYNFRKSGGKVGNVALLNDKIVGGSFVFNQLITTGNKGKIVTANSQGFALIQSIMGITTDHVVLFIADGSAPTGTSFGLVGRQNGSYYQVNTPLDTTPERKYIFAKCSQYDNVNGVIIRYYGTNGDACTYDNAMFFDLTRMFGATIANYIYSLGSVDGVPYFLNLFPAVYYAYNAGTLESVNTSAHKMIGKNAFDKEKNVLDAYFNPSTPITSLSNVKTVFAPCLPSTQYTVSKKVGLRFAAGYVNETPANGVNVYGAIETDGASSITITTGANAKYVVAYVFNGNYDTVTADEMLTSVQIEIGAATEYEPYKENVYSLDESLTLRGVPMLDANNNLYYDGDEYTPDGTVKRNYKEINLGDINWTKIDDWNGAPAFASDIMNEIRGIADNQIANILCVKYITFSRDALNAAPSANGICESTAKTIVIRDAALASGDAGAFKTAMQGVFLFVPLATPTTETAEPFADPQTVNADGTEQYIDYAFTQGNRDVEIPVGHDSEYNRALKLPALPSSDGAYNLKCTINNGVASYSWGV